MDSKILWKIIEKFAQLFDPEKIFVFGSTAIGEEREGSDLNLLVVIGKEMNSKERLKITEKIGESFPEISINPLVYEKKELEKLKNMKHPFILEILEQSKLLYEKND